jgi:hypothetical protein
MSHAIDVEEIDDLDEALRHLSLVPQSDRGEAWHAYMDAILEKRKHARSPLFSDGK